MTLASSLNSTVLPSAHEHTFTSLRFSPSDLNQCKNLFKKTPDTMRLTSRQQRLTSVKMSRQFPENRHFSQGGERWNRILTLRQIKN